MAVLNDLDWRTVALGAAVQVGVALPPSLVVRALDPSRDSNLPILAALVALFLAPGAAACLVAGRSRRSPITHAGAAVAVGWLVLAVITILRIAFVDTQYELFSVVTTVLPLLALVEIGVGITSAYLTQRLRRPSRP